MLKLPEYTIQQFYDGPVLPQHQKKNRYKSVAYICWNIRKGRVSVTTNNSKIIGAIGDWIFIDPLTVVSHNFSRNARIVSIHFSTNWNGLHYFPPLSLPYKPTTIEDDTLLKAALAFCSFKNSSDFNSKTPPLSAIARFHALFMNWVSLWHLLRESEFGRPQGSLDQRVSKLIMLLSQESSVKPIDYQSLSKEVKLSKVQINRIFKQATQQTPKEWKNIACLKAAKNMLQRGSPVNEIALALGFTDSSHFSKWFRKEVNQTPTSWAKAQKSIINDSKNFPFSIRMNSSLITTNKGMWD